MTHKFLILRDALPSEVRREADRNVARILAELEAQERQCDIPVLPDETEVLLGTFPLEGLDLTINPKREEVVGVHDDEVIMVLK
jgi:hypothetical protein